VLCQRNGVVVERSSKTSVRIRSAYLDSEGKGRGECHLQVEVGDESGNSSNSLVAPVMF
jgi:hypothetical protein